MSGQPHLTPVALVHNLRYNKVLHRHVVVLTVTTDPTPMSRESDAGTFARSGRVRRT